MEEAEDEIKNNALETEIGHQFSKFPKLLTEARTHSSSIEQNGGQDNSKLEHLGDAVLTLAILDISYENKDIKPDPADKNKQKRVSNEALGHFALNKKLGEDYIKMGGNAKNLRHFESIEVSAAFVEAIIGAVFLDGGYEEAKRVIRDWMNVDQNNAILLLSDSISP